MPAKMIDLDEYLKIIIDYICEKRGLSPDVAMESYVLYKRLPNSRNKERPFPCIVDQIVRCISLVERMISLDFATPVIDDDILELSAVLAERIYAYETTRQ